MAGKLGWQFVDTDAVITEKCGCSIAELFASEGEPFFRRLESETLRQLVGQWGAASEGGIVIGTGGGIVVSEENRAILRSVDAVFYLTAAVEVLAERLSVSYTHLTLPTN